ncbi:peptidoglycan-binding domain-containing protein [Bradyrhizobium lablabi]|uniref:peptidoglycan-binding domain-containing protein n=1 Tax=Bradyrhizobium lablabi TaxID=722472 RepID=UPI001BAD89C1|nr:peptidoglycan-binding domain-containing protein [Bradyrhizobium lablabi]MBR0692737.1 peptidoglycan-binding protein [Bradyrhizobium lablabi]
MPNKRVLPPVNITTKPRIARLNIDNIFGPKTDAVVRELQRLNRTKIDGIVGPVKRIHLFPYAQFSADMKVGENSSAPSRSVSGRDKEPGSVFNP